MSQVALAVAVALEVAVAVELAEMAEMAEMAAELAPEVSRMSRRHRTRSTYLRW